MRRNLLDFETKSISMSIFSILARFWDRSNQIEFVENVLFDTLLALLKVIIYAYQDEHSTYALQILSTVNSFIVYILYLD